MDEQIQGKRMELIKEVLNSKRGKEYKYKEIMDYFDNKYSKLSNIEDSLVGVKIVQVTMKFNGNITLRNKICSRLFGCYIKMGNKIYYRDGVVCKWINGQRVNRIWYKQVAKGVYLFTLDDWNIIRDNVIDDELEKGSFEVEVREVGGVMDYYAMKTYNLVCPYCNNIIKLNYAQIQKLIK
jgi:hypothetical protein